MPQPFSGEIKLDIRDSTPDWPAFLADRGPDGAPTYWLYCTTTPGGGWSPYGGRINMPTMDCLVANGLT